MAESGPGSGEGTLTDLPHVDRMQAGQHQPEPGGRGDHPGQTGVMRDFTAEGSVENLVDSGGEGPRRHGGWAERDRDQDLSDSRHWNTGVTGKTRLNTVKGVLGFLPD